MRRLAACLGAVAVSAAALAGCAVGLAVPGPPPGPLVEVRGVTPGASFVWVDGYWSWRSRWVWVPGSWAAPPHPRAVWVPGHWFRRGAGWRWAPGFWR